MMESIYDRTVQLGEYVPEPDDDRIICRCEEVTKGEIQQEQFTMECLPSQRSRRYLRCGMGLCQGQTCAKLVKRNRGEQNLEYPRHYWNRQHPELP